MSKNDDDDDNNDDDDNDNNNDDDNNDDDDNGAYLDLEEAKYKSEGRKVPGGDALMLDPKDEQNLSNRRNVKSATRHDRYRRVLQA
ncbi:hypothetical protein KC353_g2557 [Hortaea werneckii]|nr:hypothetical protein KC353_g2557 [Hortaea werneckii]